MHPDAELTVSARSQRAGDRVDIVLQIELPADTHIEPNHPADPSTIPTVVSARNLSDVRVSYPEPVLKDLGWHGVLLTVLEGTVEFTVSGRVSDDSDTVGGTIRFRPCVGRSCLPVQTLPWTAPVSPAIEHAEPVMLVA